MRILLVEDSVRLRVSVARALRRSGYVVDESGDGEDGLWRARESSYDGMILDPCAHVPVPAHFRAHVPRPGRDLDLVLALVPHLAPAPGSKPSNEQMPMSG